MTAKTTKKTGSKKAGNKKPVVDIDDKKVDTPEFSEQQSAAEEANKQQPAETPTDKESDDQGTHLHVRAIKDGFRRAGRAWSRAGEIINVADFTFEQLDALMTEPRLIVESTDAPDEAKDAE